MSHYVKKIPIYHLTKSNLAEDLPKNSFFYDLLDEEALLKTRPEDICQICLKKGLMYFMDDCEYANEEYEYEDIF